jgi:hypothetical protein
MKVELDSTPCAQPRRVVHPLPDAREPGLRRAWKQPTGRPHPSSFAQQAAPQQPADGRPPATVMTNP